MALSGTVVNGVIILEGGARLPEGARVRVELDELEELGPPPEPYDREKELTILREALADVRAGRSVPFEAFMARLATEFQLPPAPPD
jgi:hypothetical protein